MDPITHGITGALIGKAFFAREDSAHTSAGAANQAELRQVRRVAIVAVTLGALFPDGDVVFRFFDERSVASLELHRGFTHSFLCMPLFAITLAALTRCVTKRLGIAAPSLRALALIFAAGITSHIVLDLITSYGTMIWSPLSNYRAALDLTFIVDFMMTAIVLAPQVAAWAYRTPRGSWWRCIFGWAFFALAGAGVHLLAGRASYGFSSSVVWIAAAVFAALFFLPSLQRWGYGIRRAAWCRAGVVALVLYLGAQAGAHSVAVQRVEQFARTQNLTVESLAAIPMPPSLLEWGGLIGTPTGVWEARFDLRAASQALFHFQASAPENRFVEAARALPSVKTYLWFARFPVVRYREEGGLHVVEFADRRFFARGDRRNPFTFRVAFDANQRVVFEGWVAD